MMSVLGMKFAREHFNKPKKFKRMSFPVLIPKERNLILLSRTDHYLVRLKIQRRDRDL